jgi:dolichol kinase
MLPGVYPFILWALPLDRPFTPVVRGSIILEVAALGIIALVLFETIQRQGERNGWGSIGGYVGCVLATFLLFPAHAEFAFTVLTVIAFGDGSATLGGMLLGGPRLPWNRRKTWTGFACFLVGAGPIASLIYWGESRGSCRAALMCGLSATLAAALAESLPSKVNDNLRVGLTAAITVVMAHCAFPGI